MWGEQCNVCGVHENEIRFVTPCKFCQRKVCNGCRLNHEGVCEIVSKRKQRGEGPTVRSVSQEVPVTHSVGMAEGLDFNIPPKGTKIEATEEHPAGETVEIPQTEIDEANAQLAEAEANEAAREVLEHSFSEVVNNESVSEHILQSEQGSGEANLNQGIAEYSGEPAGSGSDDQGNGPGVSDSTGVGGDSTGASVPEVKPIGDE